MKTSRVFEIARENLWDGKSSEYREGFKEKFCCIAIMDNVSDRDAASRGGDILEDLLGPHNTLEGWLVEWGYLPGNYYYCADKKLYREKIQTTRKAWLKHLIKHYKALGD